MAVPNNSGGKRPASRATSRLAGVSHTTVSFVVNNVATANIIPGDAGARACRTSRNSTIIPFTSPRYLASLQASDGRISMDGKGRALDNMFTERL
jgi:hypothetical protein